LILAVVDQRQCCACDDAILARRAQRERKMREAALEQGASVRYVTMLTVNDEGALAA
jgi:hypothetical protein